MSDKNKTGLDGLQKALADGIGLNHYEDIRPIVIVIFTVVITYCNFYLATIDHDYILSLKYFLLTPLTAIFGFFSATIVHNSIHVPLFPLSKKTKWKQQWWQYLLTASYGYPVTTLVPGHNLSHHKYTQQEKDVIHTDQMQWRYNLINLLTFLIVVAKNITWQDALYLNYQRLHNKPMWFQCQREIMWLLAHQLFVMGIDWKAWFFCVFLPQIWAKYAIITINLLQHDGCPPPEEDAFNFARNFTGTTINYFTCNNGYHTIHHNQPGMHWSLAKDEHDKKIKPYCHPGVNHDNILIYIWNTFFMNRRVTFDNKPYFPAKFPVLKPWYSDKIAEVSETYSDKSRM